MRPQLRAVILVSLLCATHCLAQQNISAKIDRYIKAEMRRQQIPGIALAVFRNGKPAFLKTYGFSNLEHRIPVKPETIFQSGSIGKQFTAAAVMILVEEGTLSLDDRITKFFPDAPESWNGITIRHLLTHTAGMGEYPADLDLRRDFTEDEYFALIKSVPPVYSPGKQWDYSNLDYVTLGILIHKITGKFYGDFLAERIFRPLGMETARVISEADIVPNRAAGYRLVNGELKNQEWVSPSTNTTADGSLYFSLIDLAKWDAALYSDKPLKQTSLAEAWTPVRLDNGRRKAYGFGWHTDTIHNRRVVYHGGAWQGFKSFIIRFPDDKLTIIVFANSWDTHEFALARGLVAIFYPEFASPSLQPLVDKDPAVTTLVRRALLQLAKGTANPKLFSPEAQRAIFPNQAKLMGDQLNSLSLPVAIIFTNDLVGRREDLRNYRYAMIDLGKTLFCDVTLTRDNLIARLELSPE